MNSGGSSQYNGFKHLVPAAPVYQLFSAWLIPGEKYRILVKKLYVCGSCSTPLSTPHNAMCTIKCKICWNEWSLCINCIIVYWTQIIYNKSLKKVVQAPTGALRVQVKHQWGFEPWIPCMQELALTTSTTGVVKYFIEKLLSVLHVSCCLTTLSCLWIALYS